MRYGVMNSPFRPLLDEVEALGKLGFDYLEVTMDAPHAHHAVLRNIGGRLKSDLDHLGMGLVCHLPTFVSLADLTDSIREASLDETLRSMEVAVELGAEKVVLHPWFANGLGAMMAELCRERGLAALDRLLLFARQLKLPVCLENLFPRSRSLVSPADFAPVLAGYPDVRMTLDTGHANIGGGNGRIIEFLASFRNSIGHIHVSDNHGHNDDHLPVGAGLIDFRGVTATLREIGYDGTVTFEIFSPDREYLRISRGKFAGMLQDADSGSACSK